MPLTSEHDNLFFRVVAKRYENGVIIVISNLSCRVVDQAFGDPVLTAAMLDRLLGIGCSSSYTPPVRAVQRYGMTRSLSRLSTPARAAR